MIGVHSPQQLGQALRTARKQLGLTHPKLALASGVGVRFIVDLEAGKPTLRLEIVLRVIEALGGELYLDGLPSSTPSITCSNAPQALRLLDYVIFNALIGDVSANVSGKP